MTKVNFIFTGVSQEDVMSKYENDQFFDDRVITNYTVYKKKSLKPLLESLYNLTVYLFCELNIATNDRSVPCLRTYI